MLNELISGIKYCDNRSQADHRKQIYNAVN
jgi:hypothetical protein